MVSVSFLRCTCSSRSQVCARAAKCILSCISAGFQHSPDSGTCGMTSRRYGLFVDKDMVHSVLIELMDGPLVLRTSVRRTLPGVHILRGSCNSLPTRVWRNVIEKHIVFVMGAGSNVVMRIATSIQHEGRGVDQWFGLGGLGLCIWPNSKYTHRCVPCGTLLCPGQESID